MTTSSSSAPRRRGRRPALSEADRAVLAEIVRETPHWGADRLTQEFNRRMERSVSDDSVRYALRAMGWRRMPRPAAPKPPVPPDAPRYRKHHRQGAPAAPRGYPSDVSDAEWERVEPLLRGSRGPAPDPQRLRSTFNALLYMARTGCQWRYLPRDFPPWNTVAVTFYRWVERGVWAKLQHTLRRQIRLNEGKQEAPSAAIVDSQSVKTTEKGGSAATMPERKPREGSDISS